MINGITCTHRATGQLVEIPLNYKEMQFALDEGNTLLDSWNLLILMLIERLDLNLQGNYELETITVNSKTRPLH
jgi:hypothetical protein